MSLHGFTLIETLIGIALSLSVLGFVMFIGFDAYSKELERSDANAILTALFHARAESVNGVCISDCASNKAHGVYITPSSIAVFEGESYASREQSADEVFSLSDNSSISGALEIVFSPISAQVSTTTTTQISQPNSKIKIITVYPSGLIDANL